MKSCEIHNQAKEKVRDEYTAVAELRCYLDSQGVADRAALLGLLIQAWPQLSGGDEHAMALHKLRRLESPSWQAPLLRFRIERHGGTVLGSKRAELQIWELDLENCTAEAHAGGVRQLVPNSPRLDVRKLATEIAQAVNNNPQDERLEWLKDGRVQPVLARIIPANGPKQTVEGRRRRLRQVLPEAMAATGWHESGRGKYERELGRETDTSS